MIQYFLIIFVIIGCNTHYSLEEKITLIDIKQLKRNKKSDDRIKVFNINIKKQKILIYGACSILALLILCFLPISKTPIDYDKEFMKKFNKDNIKQIAIDDKNKNILTNMISDNNLNTDLINHIIKFPNRYGTVNKDNNTYYYLKDDCPKEWYNPYYSEPTKVHHYHY